MTKSQRIHRYLIWQHRWTGLLMAVFLTIVGITGSLLIYTPEIERVINPQFFARPRPGVQPLSLGEIAERVEAQEPLVRVGYFFNNWRNTILVRTVPRTNPATGKPYDVAFDHVFVDPWTGNMLAHRGGTSLSQGKANIMPFIRYVHTNLAMGEWGGLVLGYVALVWTLDCFVGFYLTMPIASRDFWRRWRVAWGVKFRASSFRVNFDLHRAGGLWFWPILLVLAWSSVYFELLNVYERIMKAAVPYETSAEFDGKFSPHHPVEHPKLSWRDAEAQSMKLLQEEAARRHFQILRPALLAYIEPYGVYSYGVLSSLDTRANNPDTGLYLDGNTGEMRHLFLPNAAPIGNRFTNLIDGLHFGDFRAWQTYRLLECIVGLVISLLSVTGVYIWWKKRRVRRDTARRAKSKGGALSFGLKVAGEK